MRSLQDACDLRHAAPGEAQPPLRLTELAIARARPMMVDNATNVAIIPRHCLEYALWDDDILFRICESESIMTKTLAPEVRTDFAKRLKDMRQQKGFPRARYFAKTLGVEENRYTRYERAEVEPSLTLIHKMCEVLQVTPNQLLGFPRRAAPAQVGFDEDGVEGLAPLENPSERQVEPQAWRLASMLAAVRAAHGTRPADPLALMGETSRMFQQLLRDPFNTVAGLMGDEALQALEPERKAEIARLVHAFTQAASESPSGGQRR